MRNDDIVTKSAFALRKGAKHLTREDRRIADTNPPMAGGQAVYAVCLPLRVQVVVLQSVTEA